MGKSTERNGGEFTLRRCLYCSEKRRIMVFLRQKPHSFLRVRLDIWCLAKWNLSVKANSDFLFLINRIGHYNLFLYSIKKISDNICHIFRTLVINAVDSWQQHQPAISHFIKIWLQLGITEFLKIVHIIS